jgi:creatinine amidohydrolase
MPKQFWSTLSTTDFIALNKDTTLVVMPVGSTEQHGPHLPVGTDAMIVDEIIRRLISDPADMDLLLLPTLWCTKSIEHDAFDGTLSLQTETLIAVMHDMAASIARAGFKRLVLMNWHGGNSDLLSSLVRDLRQRHQLLVFLIDGLFIFSDRTGNQELQNQDYDLHAGRFETGIMLAAYPQLVKPGPYEGIGSDAHRGRLAASFNSHSLLQPEGGTVRLAWLTDDLSADGVIGNPGGASATDGEAVLNEISRRVLAILREITSFSYKQ